MTHLVSWESLTNQPRNLSKRGVSERLKTIADYELDLAISVLAERKMEIRSEFNLRWDEAEQRETLEGAHAWLDPKTSPRAVLLETLAQMVEQHEAQAEAVRKESAGFLGRVMRRGPRVWKSNRP